MAQVVFLKGVLSAGTSGTACASVARRFQGQRWASLRLRRDVRETWGVSGASNSAESSCLGSGRQAWSFVLVFGWEVK